MNHKEIVAYLGENYGDIKGWWQQMITVSYEMTREMRQKHQRPAGYEISVSRAIDVPVSSLYMA
jgi:hypothetical protein